jgi:phytanoyl-CoA hydroxylase
VIHMLSRQQIEDFNRDGYLDGGNVLDHDEIGELRDELARVIGESREPATATSSRKPVAVRNLGTDPDPIVHVVNIWQGSEAFERLIYNPIIVKTISQLCPSPDLIMYHDQVVYKPPQHGGVVGWHQDAPYWTVVQPTTPVSAWVALDDVDDDNGAMWMVPGSHRWGDASNYLRRLQKEDFYRPGARGFEPPAEAPLRGLEPKLRKVGAGGVIYHHAWTWHGSNINRCDRPRRAVAIHYVTGEAVFNARGEHDVKHLISLNDGEPMRRAGASFPIVCQGGDPVPAPVGLSV